MGSFSLTSVKKLLVKHPRATLLPTTRFPKEACTGCAAVGFTRGAAYDSCWERWNGGRAGITDGRKETKTKIPASHEKNGAKRNRFLSPLGGGSGGGGSGETQLIVALYPCSAAGNLFLETQRSQSEKQHKTRHR